MHMSPQDPDSVADLPTIFDSKTCSRRGYCVIFSQHSPTNETHSLYFEQHGTGPIHVLFVNGLNASSFAWNIQVEELLARDQGQYSVMVFDNRGVGYSGYPPVAERYTTSNMAEDAIQLLDFVGWLGRREVHLVGVSLGGMIAQEIAYRIPDRISSLVLAVTTPGRRPLWRNLPPWTGLKALLRLFVTPDVEKKIPIIMNMLFPSSWLHQIDKKDPQGRMNRQVQVELYIRRSSLTKKQRLIGHASQLLAGLTHSVSPDRLRFISKSIPKILIICGDQDHLVDVKNSVRLKEAMPEAELVQWKDTGHGVYSQRPKEFHDLLVRVFDEAIARS